MDRSGAFSIFPGYGYARDRTAAAPLLLALRAPADAGDRGSPRDLRLCRPAIGAPFERPADKSAA